MPESLLYVSDLDGTLLDSRGELSERSRSVLRALLEEGLPLTVASARSYFSIKSVLGDLPFALPIIEFNGAFLTDYNTGRHLQVNALNQELSSQVLDVILNAKLSPFVSSFNGREDCLHYADLINEGMRWYEERRRAAADPRLRPSANLHSVLGESVVSLTVMAGMEEVIRALEQQLAEEYGENLQMYCYQNEYHKGSWWLTIHSPLASKHIAMQALRDEFMPRAQIVAFGDNHNDIEMLRSADCGVAVDNAIVELKRVADEVIGPANDDSVAEYLLQRVRGTR
jgi:5-amino-6-(5-phospho-D-ribitylamino)uracil phosphatase